MCSYIVEKARLTGTAKGPGSAWMRVDTANVYYDHPYEAQLDHALCVDFVCEANGGRERVAIEISRESALELIEESGWGTRSCRTPRPSPSPARWSGRRRRSQACSKNNRCLLIENARQSRIPLPQGERGSARAAPLQ